MPYVRIENGKVVEAFSRPQKGRDLQLMDEDSPLVIAFRTPSKEAQRTTRYMEVGATPDQMVIALWEKIMENRPQAADAMQSIRQQVKQEIP